MTRLNNAPPYSTPDDYPPNNHPPDNHPLIQASELAQYSFCHRAWWLGTVKKHQPQSRGNLVRGRHVHLKHEQQVRQAIRWRKTGLWLMAAGSLFLILAVLGLWLGGG